MSRENPRRPAFVPARALLAKIRSGGRLGLYALLLAGIAWAEAPAPYTITYTLKQPGQVSLAVYDARGRLLRELLRGARQEAGEHRAAWDGLDRYGQPAPAGEVEWRLLRNDGLQAEYLLSFGSNPSSAPYHLWVGNHAGPTSVHVDEHGNLYASAYCAENAPTLLRQSLDGRRRDWEKYRPEVTEGRWEGGMALATDGRGALYMLQHNGLVQVIDSATGNLLVNRVGSRANAGEVSDRAKRKWDPLPDGIGSGADIAARGDTFVVCGRDRGDVRWLRLDDGRVEHTVKVAAPLSLDLGPDGTVYVVSENRVLAVTQSGQSRTVVEGLVNPGRLAFDDAKGHLLVAHGEPRPNQVSRFNLDGTLLRTYGKAGGRRFGPYEPRDFHNIVDLAADRQGGFLVVESGPETFRRTARFDAEGELLAEWHGGQKWGSFVAFDPDDPARVLFNGGEEVKALAVADYSARTYRVTHLLRAPDTGGLMPSLTGHESLWHLRRVGGDLYMVNPGGHVASSAPAVFRLDLERGLAVPAARAGNVPAGQVHDFRNNQPKPDAPRFWRDAMARLGAKADRQSLQRGENLGFSWSDDNGNGEPDPDEVVLGPSLAYTAAFIDAEWNLLLAGSPADPDAPFVWRVPNRNAGRMPPRWVWADAQPTAYRPPAEWKRLGRSSSEAVYRGGDSCLYVFAKGHAHPGDDRQGETWPANTSGAARLMKWTAAGELEWSVGRAANVNNSLPGEFHDPMRVLGEYRGNIVVQDRVIRVAQVFTPDGLYAGDFFDRHAEDALPAEIYTAVPKAYQPGVLLHDNIAGVMHVAPTGEVLWNPSGRTGAPVYRVRGWDGWERQSGRLRIAEPATAAAREGKGLPGLYFPNRQWKDEPVLRRTDAELWFGNRTLAATRDLSGRPWFDPKSKPPFDPAGFSARWEGWIEAPFSESFRFFIESEYGSEARLWLDGREIASGKHEGKRQAEQEGRTVRAASEPVPLVAGRRYAIRLDYAGGGRAPQLHLIWESFSQERQHVPTALMYGEKAD